MKFNFLRIMALVLVAVMCLSMFACNTGDNGNNGGADTTDNGGNGGNGGTPKTENELFAELKAAYEASVSHTGAMTITGAQSQTRSYPGQDAVSMEVIAKISADLANARCFVENKQSYNGKTYVDLTKIFTVGDALYLYEADGEDGDLDEEFEKYDLADVESAFNDADANMLNESFEESMGGTFIADSYDELTAAFANTYPKLLENQINLKTEDYKLEEDSNLGLDYDISIAEKDGEIVLTSATTFTGDKMWGSGNDLMKNLLGTMTRTYKAKDGKISGFVFSITTEFDSEVDGEAIGKVEQEMSIDYDISYTFDEAGYNAIEVSLPDDPSKIVEYVSRKEIKFVVGCSSRGYIPCGEYDSVGEILAAGAAEVEERFDTRQDPETGETIKMVTVKGFYKDAEFKEKLDESATMEELLALDYVYVDVEIADGYAIVDFNNKEEDQTTREYKIVFAGSLYGQAHSVGGSNLRPAGKPVTFNYRAEEARDYKVLVNGVETYAESFIPESGKVYVVTYVEITKDRDLGITHVFVM